MNVELLQAKIHLVRITQTELNYTGSITMDMDLVDAAGMIPNQKVLIFNNNNGERFEVNFPLVKNLVLAKRKLLLPLLLYIVLFLW